MNYLNKLLARLKFQKFTSKILLEIKEAKDLQNKQIKEFQDILLKNRNIKSNLIDNKLIVKTNQDFDLKKFNEIGDSIFNSNLIFYSVKEELKKSNLNLQYNCINDNSKLTIAIW